MQNPFTYLCFSNTQALSPRGKCCPLDQDADGIVIGEGIAVAVLKRLEDAERDGDRIYAVIKGVGAASDGRDKSLTAPRPQGQIMALERAYRQAGYSPATVSLFEAHATGTTVGDATEIEALSALLEKYDTPPDACAIGSVKSMIGHTKSTAGVASLVKAALSLHHKTLPPTLGVAKPNTALRSSESSLYVNSEARPWMHADSDHPRRAGVSAFGFGGTNFHVALEEYTGEFLEHLNQSSLQRWPTELFLFSEPSRTNLLARLTSLGKALSAGVSADPAQLAYSYARLYSQNRTAAESPRANLAIVATSLEDLKQKIEHAVKALHNAQTVVQDPGGIYYYQNPLSAEAKVAFLFPGQGSQYINMFADLALIFPEIQSDFARSDDLLEDRLDCALSAFVFPKPAFSDDERSSQQADLAQTHIAQSAMGTVNMAMFRLLGSFGLKPDMVAGHSYGEYAALCAAGVFPEADLVRISEARARFINQAAKPDPGTMAAVAADSATVEETIANHEGVWVANLNAPNQTVITGTLSAIEAAINEFSDRGIRAQNIPVSCAFHSPIISPAGEPLLEFLSGIALSKPQIKVYSNTTARAYPAGPKAIARQLIKHLVQRVEFMREVEAMYADGARIFVEVGAGRVLTGLVDQVLHDRPHLALHSNSAGRAGIVQLQHLLGHLAARGVSVNVERLFKARDVEYSSLSNLLAETNEETFTPTTWLVNGSRAIPFNKMTESNPGQAVAPLRLNTDAGIRDRTSEIYDLIQASEPAGQQRQQAEPDSLQPSADETSRVLFRHQRLMQRFLQIQKSVMFNYQQRAKDSVAPVNIEADDSIQQSLIQVPTATEEPPDQPDAARTMMEPAGLPADAAAMGEVTSDPSCADKIIVSRETLTRKLLEIVSERTGYPPDMLALDLDLEAELGIDSIKRVEILGHFLQFVFGSEHGELTDDLGDVNHFKTLRIIVDQVELLQKSFDAGPPESIPVSEPVAPSSPAADVDDNSLLPRFTNAVVAADLPHPSLDLSHERVTLITDDGSGIAEALKLKLTRSGYPAAIIRFGEAPEKEKHKYYSLEDDFAKAVSEPVEIIRKRHGPLGGIVHLLPLRQWKPFEENNLTEWRQRLELDVKTLFHLLKIAQEDLRQAAAAGGGFVLSATGMGGHFASSADTGQSEFFPENAAISGLLKTVAVEWPEINVKCIDFNMQDPFANLVDHLFAEIRSDDSPVEVGYDGSQRLFVGLSEAPLLERNEDSLQIDSDWVLLITGGARGITAEVAMRLAQGYRPTLILAGRSELPSETESEVTLELTNEKDIKSALIADMKSRGESFELTQVQAAYEKICKEREIRTNLAAMRQAGARVIYEPVDVRDEQQFGRFIDHVYESQGRLDGVIHGAGVIEDKLLADKSWESFDRVFGTKTESVFVLSKKLQPETLKFMALFSSVAGRFGNAGQCDYTAANDVINKIAIYLDHRWPGRVFAVNWGPWSGGGMASEDVQRQFRERGVQPISPLQGARNFELELRKGHKGEPEVIMGEGPWRKAVNLTGGDDVIESDLPLLQKNLSMTMKNGFVEIRRRLDPDQDLYLQDHRLDTQPVMPAAMAVELMAEAAQMAGPEWTVTEVRGVRVFKGIVLDAGALDLRILTRFDEDSDAQADEMNLQVHIQNTQQPQLNHYGASVVLRKAPPKPMHSRYSTPEDLEPFQTSISQAYDKWLFHGPRFQCLQHIEGISKSGMLATLAPSIPAECLSYGPQGKWLADPIVLDGGLQMALIWARIYLNITVLPSSIKAVHLHKPFHSAASIQCHLQVLEALNRQSVTYNMVFTNAEGDFLGMIEKIEATGSEALNRLTQTRAALR
jgi:acyl transferase domain-containing protein/NAD(P)-dependent dehydrogenase (short-subunit alcohol dehydrogenase family)